LAASTLNKEVVTEKISTRHLLVHELNVNPEGVRGIIEENKTKFFTKLGFLKPKQEEIDCESILLFYESFLIAKANYFLDYYEKKKYRIRINNKTTQVKIFGQILEPVISMGRIESFLKRSHKEVVFEGEERVIYEKAKKIALNRKGREINPEKLPKGTTEPEPQKVLVQCQERVRDLGLSIVDTMREIICKRPPKINRVIEEAFEVTEQYVVYTPIYEARCRHLKTKETKIIPISGVTGQMLSL
jgi:hypothetical protein